MALVGRRLKRKHGVRLGILYHLFALCLAVYLPAKVVELHWEFVHHLGAATVLLGATFLIALLERYIWEIYFQEHHSIHVPKFLTEVTRVVILVVALFLVLEFGYDQTIKGLLLAPGIA